MAKTKVKNTFYATFEPDKYESYVNELFNKTSSHLLNNIRKYFTILSNIDYKLNQTMQKV